MALDIHEILLGPHMTKFHFQQPGIPAMHEIRAPDLGDYHDHPFPMHSFILFGGYVEEIMTPWGQRRHAIHQKGESFLIPARRIHRIVALLDHVCWTITLPGAFVRPWGSWQFREDGPWRREWGQENWIKVDHPEMFDESLELRV